MWAALTQAKTQNKAFFATVRHSFITPCIHSDFFSKYPALQEESVRWKSPQLTRLQLCKCFSTADHVTQYY